MAGEHPDTTSTAAGPRRRGRGELRLRGERLPLELDWGGQRWMRVVRRAARTEVLDQGFELARSGNTRSIEIQPGRVVASVQGQGSRVHRVVIQFDSFDHDQWHGIIEGVASQHQISARMLAGDCPPGLEELFASVGVELFPDSDEGVLVTSDCPDQSSWCAHVCCVALVVAEMFDSKPQMIFALRGLPADELLERVRERRVELSSLAGEGSASAARGAMTTADLDRPRCLPLEACLEHFWEPGSALDDLDTTIRPPEVSHALLRRLGPSPFTEGRFPLVGLLATCYDVITKAALRQEQGGGEGSCSGLDEPSAGAD